jgi:hypothetical protein
LENSVDVDVDLALVDFKDKRQCESLLNALETAREDALIKDDDALNREEDPHHPMQRWAN